MSFIKALGDSTTMTIFRKIKHYIKDKKVGSWIFFLLLVYVVLVVKIITLRNIDNNYLLGIYSFGIALYILSRFALAHFYEPDHMDIDLDNALPSHLASF